jgi:hypothetical protein
MCAHAFVSTRTHVCVCVCVVCVTCCLRPQTICTLVEPRGPNTYWKRDPEDPVCHRTCSLGVTRRVCLGCGNSLGWRMGLVGRSKHNAHFFLPVFYTVAHHNCILNSSIDFNLLPGTYNAPTENRTKLQRNVLSPYCESLLRTHDLGFAHLDNNVTAHFVSR